MHVACYVRVSTIEQRDEGYSLDNQKDRLLAYCKSQGWDEAQIYMDDGFTGTDMNRPGLKRLIRHIQEKQVSAVVVLKLDRLSRKQKDALYLLEDVFEKHGVIFKAVNEPFDTSSPLGKAMLGVLAVFAQLERDMIVERTTSGRRQRTSEGKWYGGQVPFGYSWIKEDDRLEILPDEARIIQEIYTRYQQGQSRLSIAEWAQERVAGRTIDHTIIREILSRPIYMGKLMNAGTLVDGNHEAIIEPEQWYAVQVEVSRRKEGLTPIGEYLLTGLLRCGICNAPVVHVKRRTKTTVTTHIYELYGCRQQHVRKKDRNNHCTLGYFRRHLVEEYVIDKIKRISLHPEEYEEEFERRSEVPDAKIESSISLKVELVDTQLANLYDAIQSGMIKASNVGDRIRKLEEERETLVRQLDDFKDSAPVQQKPEEFLQMLQSIGKAWDFMETEDRKKLIRTIVNQVTLQKDGNHEIEWRMTL